MVQDFIFSNFWRSVGLAGCACVNPNETQSFPRVSRGSGWWQWIVNWETVALLTLVLGKHKLFQSPEHFLQLAEKFLYWRETCLHDSVDVEPSSLTTIQFFWYIMKNGIKSYTEQFPGNMSHRQETEDHFTGEFHLAEIISRVRWRWYSDGHEGRRLVWDMLR